MTQPVTPKTEKETVLKIISPLSGRFFCVAQDGKHLTTFISDGQNSMAVSKTDPSLKGKPSMNLEAIDTYAVSCNHAENLINDYYRRFSPK
jgi:hypothetical protein